MSLFQTTFEKIQLRSVCYKGGSSAPKPTADMKEAARIAAQQWNDYQTRFVPFENKYIADIKAMDDTNQLQGMVNADVMQKTQGSAINPTQAGKAGVQGEMGKVMSAGATDARAGALDRKAAGLNTVVSMGRGQQTEALQGLTNQAKISQDTALSNARLDLQERGSDFGMYGSMAGAATGIAKGMSQQPSALQQVQTGAAPYSSGTNGVSGGAYLGQDLYAGDLR